MEHNIQKVLASYERDGYYFPGAKAMLRPEWAQNFQLAMDAQPALVTTPSSGIPAFLTTIIDPNILKIRQAANNAALIFEEVRKGTWVTESALFPVVERGGTVTSYGDFEAGGTTTVNANFPARQPYLFQTFCVWGELQMERAGLAKIGWAAELQGAAADVLGKFENLAYFKGIAGLQNYGIQTYPNLEIINAIQYGAITGQNPQGVAAGEMAQMIAPDAGGQQTGWVAYNEKLRAHRVVPSNSSFSQKLTSGVFGAILRQPFAIATMIGI